MQQGRVTVEADWNEAQMISSEETRKEALDFVGPAGTPDNGYAITVQPNSYDFQIGPGSMYVGGVRAFLPQAEAYSQQQQSDWMDWAVDGDWVPVPTATPANEYVYLLLREQEVSGVEDSDLNDVALGGPDTAQRTRLVQHVERLTTTGTDCASALAAAETTWATEGFALDQNDMRVRSFARMQVQFVPPPASTACDPTAPGGYLGADNQLIRVQISDASSSAPMLLWGYDDASFLYRVTVTDSQTLTLQTAPVDAEHMPQGGRAVEVLLNAAALSNGQYVAAATGQVESPLAASPYTADSKTLSLPVALQDPYTGTAPYSPPQQVFLRVWEQELPFTPGTPVMLGDTGVQVILTTENSEPFRVGDYWMFAVRPGTPQQVYPERYLVTNPQAAPQPPDGPREWICPLAVILWSSSGQVVNCRNPFDTLVTRSKTKKSGCCTVNVSPADITATNTLQAIVAKYSGPAGVNICLAPGTYNLANPLSLDKSNGHVHFEACAGGAIFSMDANADASLFLHGMVILNGVDDVSFEGIQFQLPLVPVGAATMAGAAVDKTIDFSIGIRPVNSSNVRIRNCQFAFNSGSDPLLAIGILGAGECTGFQLEGNGFEMPPSTTDATGFFAPRATTVVAIGFVLFPSIVSSAIRSEALLFSGASAQVLPSELQQTVIRDNYFSGLMFATFVYADIGLLQVEANTVRNCTWGLWFLTLPALAYADNTADVATAPYAANVQSLLGAISTAAAHPSVQFTTGLLRGFPLPQNVDLSKAIAVTVRKPITTLKDNGLLRNAFDRFRTFVEKVAGDTVAAQAQATAIPKAGIAMLNQNFNIIEKQAFPAETNAAIPLALHLNDNDVNLSGTGSETGLALFVWDLGTNDQDAVSLTGNTFVGEGPLPVALIAGVLRCVCTGNMVLNEGTADNQLLDAGQLLTAEFRIGAPSFWLFPVTVQDSSDPNGKTYVNAAAVTGNVFRGRAHLPARKLNPAPPAPMDTWHFFNAET